MGELTTWMRTSVSRMLQRIQHFVDMQIFTHAVQIVAKLTLVGSRASFVRYFIQHVSQTCHCDLCMRDCPQLRSCADIVHSCPKSEALRNCLLLCNLL